MIAKYKNIIKEISKLPKNWDGYGADEISIEVTNNADAFLDLVFDFFRSIGYNTFEKYNTPFRDIDITPTPYGSIVIDFQFNNYRTVSTEIGKDSIGWYCKDVDGITSGPYTLSDIMPCNFKELPNDYRLCLRKICFIPSSAYIDIEAYIWVGSSPCEDCDNRCEYSDENNWCEDKKEWNKEYQAKYKELKEHYGIS